MTPVVLKYWILVFLTVFYASFCSSKEDFYSFTAKTITGEDFDFEQLRGSVSLVVNVASECGFTDSHYRAFPKLQAAMEEIGKFQILAFPCNQFGEQEPGDNFDIMEYVTSKYYMSYKLFEKIDVHGPDAHPAWKYLIEESEIEPNWNFFKYLVDADGQFVNAWGPKTGVDQVLDFVQEEVLKTEKAGEETDEPDLDIKKHLEDEL